MFCINWLHLFHLMLCCGFVATPWPACVPSWLVILSYTAWICAAAIVSVTINSLRSSHGKANRLSFCHIPFRSEGNFWQECCCPARWLKGSFGSVSAVDLSTQTFTHTQVSTHALRKKKHIQPLCEPYTWKHTVYSWFRTSNTWKTIVRCLKNGSPSVYGQ